MYSQNLVLLHSTLVIDDSVHSGTAMYWARTSLQRMHRHVTPILAALYPRPAAEGCVDLYSRLLPIPHLFEWNLFNCNQTQQFAFDFDGILCSDWVGEDEEGEAYTTFLHDAQPRWLPRRLPVPLIVTARLERHRTATESWLHTHGVRVERLVMGNWHSAAERRQKFDAAAHKGRPYANSTCVLFVESDVRQAELIFHEARKPVLCPGAGRVFQ